MCAVYVFVGPARRPERSWIRQLIFFCFIFSDNFRGRIPESLGRLKNLEYLYVDGNAFTGTMPDDVCSLVENNMLGPVLADCDGSSGGLECDPECCECV